MKCSVSVCSFFFFVAAGLLRLINLQYVCAFVCACVLSVRSSCQPTLQRVASPLMTLCSLSMAASTYALSCLKKPPCQLSVWVFAHCLQIFPPPLVYVFLTTLLYCRVNRSGTPPCNNCLLLACSDTVALYQPY